MVPIAVFYGGLVVWYGTTIPYHMVVESGRDERSAMLAVTLITTTCVQWYRMVRGMVVWYHIIAFVPPKK